MAVYLKIPDIKGGATEDNHKEWIKVDSLQFAVTRNLKNPFGAATNRESGHPTVSEIHVTKPMDNSSLDLWAWAVDDFNTKTVKVDVVSTAKSKEPFATYSLENCVISGYQVSASGEAMPHESFSLNFTKIEKKFMQVSGTMKGGSPVTKGFDLTLGKKT